VFPPPNEGEHPPYKNLYDEDEGWGIHDEPLLLLRMGSKEKGYAMVAKEDIPFGTNVAFTLLADLRRLTAAEMAARPTIVDVEPYSEQCLIACYGECARLCDC
jgi:hypothetical protein